MVRRLLFWLLIGLVCAIAFGPAAAVVGALLGFLFSLKED